MSYSQASSARVLRLEVVPVVVADHPHLGQHGRLGRAAGLALQHAALDLAADDRGLDQHLRVDLAGGGDRRVELRPVVDLGDAEATSRRGTA